jgi:hypothetical protein
LNCPIQIVTQFGRLLANLRPTRYRRYEESDQSTVPFNHSKGFLYRIQFFRYAIDLVLEDI